MNQLTAVGFAPEPPEDEIRRAIDAVNELRTTLGKLRKAFNERRMRELDTEIANAWMISTEIEQRLANTRKSQ